VSVAFAEVEEIDEINILRASLLAMKRAIAGLKVKSGTVLVDGNRKIPKLSKKFEQITIIKGDFRAKPIGAASIVAKVERDQEMKQLAEIYPQYGFEKHKGYASESHRKAIQEFGPERPSAVSKSTLAESKSKSTVSSSQKSSSLKRSLPPAHLRGLRSELNVAISLSQTRGWILKAHRFKTRFAELDLIFEERTSNESFVHIVEVKSCQKLDWQEHRVTAKQRLRLMRSRDYLENLWRKKVCLHLAVATQSGEVQLLEDICS
jgi:ribonuclease HII/Holliday junction resolvase-like predicted endonuclease